MDLLKIKDSYSSTHHANQRHSLPNLDWQMRMGSWTSMQLPSSTRSTKTSWDWANAPTSTKVAHSPRSWAS